jgi:hypothetical protein
VLKLKYHRHEVGGVNEISNVESCPISNGQ